MAKSKLEKHLEELGEATSGGAHDAVTFSGRGLNLLKSLFKSKGNSEEGDDSLDEMELDDLEDIIEEEDLDAPRKKREESDEDYADRLRAIIRKARKKPKKATKNANGGGLEEEEEEDLVDPADSNKDSIITNQGERINKNANGFDKRRFEKNFDDLEAQHEEVLDASPALADIAKQVRLMAKSQTAAYSELQDTIIVLAKGLEQSLKAQASMAADLELIKKQPANQPASGFVFTPMNKNNANGDGQRKLSKSDVQDSLTDMVNEGLVGHETLARMDFIQNDRELQSFVESLPSDVQNRL